MADEPGPHPGGPVRAALATARDVRWRAPELAWAWCARAGAPGDGDWGVRLETETLAAFAANRLGLPVTAAGRAVPVVRELPARHTSDPAADRILGELYVELAWCAGACGAADTARHVLRSVLDSEIGGGLRAHALLAAAALPQSPAERVAVLDESERLCSALPAQASLPALARVAAARAVHWRRSGEFRTAAEVAEAGLSRLEQFDDPAADSGAAWSHLVLERVQALLELGAREQAEAIAAHAVRQPARAAAAPHLAWIGLVLATRVQIPRGDLDAAVRVLHDAVALADRHGLDAIGVDVHRALSHVHERADRPHAALRALRTAHAIDRRWRSAVHTARLRLCTEVPAALPVPAAAAGATRPWPTRSWSARSWSEGAPRGEPLEDEPPAAEAAGPGPSAAEPVPAQRGREEPNARPGSAARPGYYAAEQGTWSGRTGQHWSAMAEDPTDEVVAGGALSAGSPPAGGSPVTGAGSGGRRRAAAGGAHAAERGAHAGRSRAAHAEAAPAEGARRSRRSSTPAAEVLARYLPAAWSGGTGAGHRAGETATGAAEPPAAAREPFAAAGKPSGSAELSGGEEPIPAPGAAGGAAADRPAGERAAREAAVEAETSGAHTGRAEPPGGAGLLGEAGAPRDAGPRGEAGASRSAAVPGDAGPLGDAGPPGDAPLGDAPLGDAGVQRDAAVPGDSGTSGEAGSPGDARLPGDARSPGDAGAGGRGGGGRGGGAHAKSDSGISALDIILSARAAESRAADLLGGGRHAGLDPDAPAAEREGGGGHRSAAESELPGTALEDRAADPLATTGLDLPAEQVQRLGGPEAPHRTAEPGSAPAWPEPASAEAAERIGTEGAAEPPEEAPRWPRAVDLDTVVPAADPDGTTPAEPPVERVWPSAPELTPEPAAGVAEAVHDVHAVRTCGAPSSESAGGGDEARVKDLTPEDLAALADQAGADPRAADEGPLGAQGSTAEPPPPEVLADQAGVAPSGRHGHPDWPAEDPTARDLAGRSSTMPEAQEPDVRASEPAESSEPRASESPEPDGPGPTTGAEETAAASGAAEEVDPSNAGLADLLAGALAAFENTRGRPFDETDPAGLPAQGAPVSISDLRAAENSRPGGESGDHVLDGDAATGSPRRRPASG